MNGPKRDALTCEALDHIDELGARNQLLAAEALQPVHTAVSVRVRNGRFSSTDGPFAETKEQLGGFVLIHAIDLNEALLIVAKIRWRDSDHPGTAYYAVRKKGSVQPPAGG